MCIRDSICGRYIGQGQLNDFAFATGLPLDSEFRLLCFKFNEERPENDPTELMEPVRRLNEGKDVYKRQRRSPRP